MKKILFTIITASIFIIGICMPTRGEAAVGDRTLSYGTSHSDVKELQELLMTKGVFPYHEATGYFGPITKESVKKFQEKSRLKVDGIAGSQTNQKIKVLRSGDIGKPVAELQRLLKVWGVYTSTVDGIYGTGTKQAVSNFQKQKSLSVDGIAGARTLGKLEEKANLVSQNVKELTVASTAYTASCSGCSGTTRMGVDLKKYDDAKVIAVDPNVIPLGSNVEVEGYGQAIAVDTGGAIKGNRIDVFIPKEADALTWGRKEVKVKIIE
ncbi:MULTISPECIES: peptidoglycan-binding protein [Peribacillus]|uniref:peptidoglycan-binding protein n=1 Tax=Peribacillus TaxID=2675229 RepID=UPI0019138224|nr:MULTISPECIES: peptidoglycan-binding protein [unclassified Peribacillus]MBK5443489.1 peptidoglycan-binding protein [Peribacillus sp. TH24]MBK5461777.1 peptidoglycan-binding protein [Peribacillus sp. TH27]MBK5484889.1 peptidoglycan-binding protein [Peribacillus sp. TH16]MBK5499930.1 peptidoglycan-binding protein [Peribacillus sp. TH14]WMX55016.1 peptidoglycan-binding protein [Peribacillus sp. R9-11]